MKFFLAALRREGLLLTRRRQDMINPLAFFVMVTVMFPLGISPEAKVLATIAPGVIWVAALLATLLSVDGVFRADFEDGSLDQMLTSPQSMMVLVLAKVISHWLSSGFLLALISPLLAVFLFLPAEAVPTLVVSLLLGTPALTVIGAIGAGLTVSLRKGGVLISLLVLPLYIPVLIFGTATVQAGALGLPVQGHLALLGAFLLSSLMLAPFAIAASLKISIRS